MWIRSQDKQILGEFKYFKIQRSLRKYDICASDISDIFILGEYDTFEKASVVLDSIEEWINNNSKAIFQMPE